MRKKKIVEEGVSIRSGRRRGRAGMQEEEGPALLKKNRNKNMQ